MWRSVQPSRRLAHRPASAPATSADAILAREMPHDALPRPLIIAHRGCALRAPENTLASVRAALELPVDAIEIDVYLSADGVPVVMHDPTVDRTTDGHGPVCTLTLAQLNELRAHIGWQERSFPPEPVPTLTRGAGGDAWPPPALRGGEAEGHRAGGAGGDPSGGRAGMGLDVDLLPLDNAALPRAGAAHPGCLALRRLRGHNARSSSWRWRSISVRPASRWRSRT